MTAPKQCRDMTADERLAWGIEESRLRQEDLKDVTSAAGLEAAQERARARRRAIGASMSAATSMVIEANRHLRTTGSTS